jgi:hypothetical protein
VKPTFYFDVHIARETANQLRAKGVEIIHSAEIGMEEAKDDEHWTYTIEHKLVMVTCDRGFIDRLYQRLAEGLEHPGVAYFQMEDECQSISIVVKQILFLHEVTDDPKDLYNQVWRVDK